ncbi:xenotropic and polytropic retrovirus receptor 1-like [Ischnura elegans]|uniref:xenotropic and polytropic retrovirus receptor 1-like n=1 Tax=Ischnura elegans TaxID=197161 RepID=UPI001ED882AD|nr:xenotropic and polytropic retrovirus receptor 1-like [Ischnura elegans]
MKFGENLASNITPEWRKQYINYEEMKGFLYAAVEEAPSPEVVDVEEVTRHFKNFDEKFFQYCENELKKIDTFFSEKLAESTRKMATLQSELKKAIEGPSDSKISSIIKKSYQDRKDAIKNLKAPESKKRELKLAFSEFYLSLILLQNYQNLNHTGFEKIMKKHDKMLQTNSGVLWKQENVSPAHFHVNKDVDRLLHETEETVTWKLEGGDRTKAMKRLRVPPLNERHSHWTIFKVGLFSGSLVILFIAAVLSAVFHHGIDDWHVALRIYRGPLVLVELIFLLGINVHLWQSVGVNHVLIFELDPRNHLSEQHLFEFAAVFGVAWTLSVLGFLYSSSLGIPAYAFPLGLMVIVFAFLLNPLKIFRHEARFWLLRIMTRMLCAPMFHVNFPDFWLADQVNSLWFTLLDFHYFFCFYATNESWETAGDTSQCFEEAYIPRAILAAFPAWLRFAQCCRRFRDSGDAFPHLLNAAKYSTVFFVFGFLGLHKAYEDQYQTHLDSPYFILWVISSIISSIAMYLWDVKLDFGFFDKNAGENLFLREEIIYSSKSYYYFAIVEDLVMRFNWAIIYGCVQSGLTTNDTIVSIISPLEVGRRFIWNLFRLENEHLNNCGQFRAVRDISVAPITSSDEKLMIKMMDEEDGVTECRKRKNFKKKEEKVIAINIEKAGKQILPKKLMEKNEETKKAG